MNEGIQQIQSVGASVAQLLDGCDLDDGDFAKVAEEALVNVGELSEVSLPEVALFLASAAAPEQIDWPFSDLPVVLYRHPRFYLQLLHWTNATTAVHEHAFAGAFRVVSGSSLHSRYQIEDRQPVADEVEICSARHCQSERLPRGAVRRIDPGADGLVHSLYHLDNPSVSLVLRTFGRSLDQFSLAKPRLWWNQGRLSASHRQKAIERASIVAERTSSGSGRELIASIADRLSDGEWVSVALLWAEHVATREEFERLLAVRSMTSERIDQALLDGYESLVTERLLGAARESIRDPELRLLMALLMNVPDRASLLRLVSDFSGRADPVIVVAEWLARLASYRGDPSERLARLAAAAGVDHRLGVIVRQCLPPNISDAEGVALLATAIDPSCSLAPARAGVDQLRSALLQQRSMSVLIQ